MDCEKIHIPYTFIRITIVGVFVPLIILINKALLLKATLFSTMIFFITSNRPYWIYVFAKTWRRDLSIIKYSTRVSFLSWRFHKLNMTVSRKFYDNVKKSPDKIIIETKEGSWSNLDLFNYSTKMGHVLKEVGVRQNSTVGIFFGDGGGIKQPAIWFGSSYLGAPVAIIPPQLKSISLIHCLKAAKVTHLIFSEDTMEVVKDIQNDPDIKNIRLMQYNTEKESSILDQAVNVASKLENAYSTPFVEKIKSISCSDVFIYIFTSGTTGLPKATVISHLRYLLMVTIFNGAFTKNDKLYIPLPLHHGAGSIVGLGQALVYGVPVFIRKKFSVSNFWKDCIEYNCTAAQYIGETCRFLLSAAKKSEEKDSKSHIVRTMLGNGLRPSIWRDFQKTFGITKICEFYGSTEGNVFLINIECKKDSIGYIPRWLYRSSATKIIKCDQLTGEPLRDKNGLCIECKPCEAGLTIGKLGNKKKINNFTGYLDKEATKKKYLYDVLEKGDVYFNSGDILVRDDLGYFYFKDRTGDTFRWRGENVSSGEVENVITKITNLDAVVYGVEIPNVEGRAGMAAIKDVNNNLDLGNLSKKLKSILPLHAHPLFIRIIDEVTFTTTFKLVKKDYLKEGYDISKTSDKIYFFDYTSSKYVPLTKLLYEEIMSGKHKL